jgi:uncharacterized protein
MSAVFLDTVGLLAIWYVADQWHTAAESAFSQISQLQHSLVTTTFVLLECGNAAAQRPYRAEVNQLRQVLEKRGELVVPSAEDWIRGREAFERGESGQAGIVDHVSFVIMRRLGIKEAFTNDRHFQAAGFITLF